MPVGILREARHLETAMDRHAELLDPVGQDALDVALPQRERRKRAGWGGR